MSNESTVIFATCDQCGESDCECEDQYTSLSVKDVLGNELSCVYNHDDGLMDFYLNKAKVALTTWVCETDPEICFNDFMNNWNVAQKTTLESIKLTDHTAEFILKAMCDGSYSSEDVMINLNDFGVCKRVDYYEMKRQQLKWSTQLEF